MNTIESIFKYKKDILSVYFTAGYPELNDTVSIIKSLERSGADLIEVGIPYSDPLADGPVIQQSSSKALKNGINPDIVFEQLHSINGTIKIPLVIMAYLNQLLVYGFEKFLYSCSLTGIQALIIPDLPLYEYETKYKALFETYGLSNVFLVTPQTSDERIRKIDNLTDAFIYLVSSSSITGVKNTVSEQQITYFERIKGMGLKNPTLIGFGISDHHTYKTACAHASGAIIGSAFIKALSGPSTVEQKVNEFVNSVKYGK
jgi:tryptophan synthase alpha chain